MLGHGSDIVTSHLAIGVRPPEPQMTRQALKIRFFAAIASTSVACLASTAHAVSSAELYTAKSYQYGRFEARVQFAAGDGVVSSFFLWKDGSEVAGTFWNELDFEKLGADCHLETNAFYGNPAAVHSQKPTMTADLCGGFHTYTYEWTPEYITWLVDGVEIRREIGAAATAYADNATAGMQLRLNIWPGDASFGGTFSPAILPVHEYVNWVQYSSYADGAFTLEWREDFNANTVPAGWLTGNWGSPKNLSTHKAANVNFVNGYAVLSLTADDALGSAGATPVDTGDSGGTPAIGGAGGAGGATSGTAAQAGSPGIAGSTSAVPAQASSDDDGGCSVTSPRSRLTSSAAILLSIVAGLLIGRRKRTTATR